jgi:hypothetical protein
MQQSTTNAYRPFVSRASHRTLSFTQKGTAWLVRGGASLQEEVEEEEEEEDDDDDASALQGNKAVNENDEEDEDEEDDEADATKATRNSSSSQKPVTVTIQTATGYKVLDHSLELNVNRNRDIASLKDSIRRQLPSKPPVSTMELVWRGKRLSDTTIVDELIEDEEEDDDEDDDENDEGNAFGLVLQLDMVPPIDPKFLPQLQQEIPHWTTAQLLEAYAANEAALYKNAAALFPSRSTASSDDFDEEHEKVHASNNSSLISEQIRQQAERIQTQWKCELLTSSKTQNLLADPIAPAEQSGLLITQIRGERIRQVAVAGVRTSLKLQLQRQFNIDWAASIRSFCLFLFFGWFGGRTPTSRAILLLGAPAVFVLQARQVQLLIKQMLYFLLLKPPSIVLSLLPAPQQQILVVATKSDNAMESIYGPDELAGGEKIAERARIRSSAARIDIPLSKLKPSPSLSDDELDDYVESLISEVGDDEDEEDDDEDSESDQNYEE